MEGLEQRQDGSWISTTADPQIIFRSVQANARRVLLKGEFLTAPGEVDAYFTRQADDGFSSGQRVWGRMQEDGSYVFEIPPGHVYALRLDPGSAVGVQMQIEKISVNQPAAFAEYFRVSLYTMVLFAFGPALASCFICTIIEIISIFKNNRQKAEQKKDINHGK